jgi:hypothetical protein
MLDWRGRQPITESPKYTLDWRGRQPITEPSNNQILTRFSKKDVKGLASSPTFFYSKYTLNWRGRQPITESHSNKVFKKKMSKVRRPCQPFFIRK